MKKLFKPGDRVRLKTGGPSMRVVRYEVKDHPLLGHGESNARVRCAWYDRLKGRQEKVVHQNSLMRVGRFHPLSGQTGPEHDFHIKTERR